jgi:hypothetical protein
MSIISFFKRDRTKEATAAAQNLFQVKEHGGELWMTYDGWLVCPCSMMKDEPVDAVTRMRQLYISRESYNRQ